MAKPTTKETKAIRRPGENGFRYRQQFGLIVTCASEAEQKRLYARLVKLGLRPKVVCV